MPPGADRDPCGYWQPQLLTESSGTIQSPNYPNNYDNGVDCSWQIATDKDHIIKLIVEFFETELRCV